MKNVELELKHDDKIIVLNSINLNFITTSPPVSVLQVSIMLFTPLKSLPTAKELLETLQISCLALNYWTISKKSSEM